MSKTTETTDAIDAAVALLTACAAFPFSAIITSSVKTEGTVSREKRKSNGCDGNPYPLRDRVLSKRPYMIDERDEMSRWSVRRSISREPREPSLTRSEQGRGLTARTDGVSQTTVVAELCPLLSPPLMPAIRQQTTPLGRLSFRTPTGERGDGAREPLQSRSRSEGSGSA